uniref:Uncharacterized protein n=1 Tax=Romanomermis culicivorax TaxID=13658 RepID=A0A915J2H7_ROMCU
MKKDQPSGFTMLYVILKYAIRFTKINGIYDSKKRSSTTDVKARPQESEVLKHGQCFPQNLLYAEVRKLENTTKMATSEEDRNKNHRYISNGNCIDETELNIKTFMDMGNCTQFFRKQNWLPTKIKAKEMHGQKLVKTLVYLNYIINDGTMKLAHGRHQQVIHVPVQNL